MPRIAFQETQAVPGASTLPLRVASYEEDNRLYSDQASTTFSGEAITVKNETLDVIIKVPKSISQSYLIQKEFKSLVSLADSIRQALDTDIQYTPPVQLGTHSETGLPVLVQLQFQDQMQDLVHKHLEDGDLQAADRVALDAAISLSYTMESLHDMGQTAISRSVDDYHIHNGNLIISDWSNLRKIKDDNDRGAEIGNMFGQIWYQIFTGQPAEDLVIPLDDAIWQPLENYIQGGSLCLAMRYILEVALHPNPRRRFENSARDMRIALDLVKDMIDKPFDESDFSSYMLGYDIHLNSAESDAIGYDMLWRLNGALADDPLYQKRNTAIETASKQPAREDIEDLKEDILEGNYQRALQTVDQLIATAESAVDYGRLTRWRLLIQSFMVGNEEVVNQLTYNSSRLVEMWSGLDSDNWQSDTEKQLQDILNSLEEILNNLDIDSDAFEYIALVLDEVNLRRLIVQYRDTTAPEAQQNLLNIIEPQIDSVNYIQDRSPEDLGLASQVINLQSERQRLYTILQTRDVVEDAQKSIVNHLREGNYTAVRQIYGDTILQLEEAEAETVIQSFQKEIQEYVVLADFKNLLDTESTSLTLDRKLEEAHRLSRLPRIIDEELQKKPVEWLEHDIVQARNQLIIATRSRTYTTVSQPQTHLAYQAIINHKEVFQSHYNYSNHNMDELIAEYEKLNRFFSYYLQMVAGRNLYQYPFNKEDFLELFQRAREVNANMTDIFADSVAINEWREILNLDEAETQLLEYHNRLKSRLGIEFEEQIEEFNQKVNDATRAVAGAREKQHQMLYQMVLQTAGIQVSHQVSTALASMQNFDATSATAAQQEAQKLVNGYRSTLQRDDFNQFQSQLQALKQPIEEIRQLSAMGKLPYYKHASELIRSGVLPEKSDPETYENFEGDLQENARFGVIITLQERYWALRIENARQTAAETYLADEMEQRKQGMARALRQIESAFYSGDVEYARQQLPRLHELTGTRLSDVLLYELIRVWEVRIANYNQCNDAVENIQRMLQQARQQGGDSPAAIVSALNTTPETLLTIMDLLTDKMRLCPGDAFTPPLYQRWLQTFQFVYELYATFQSRQVPPIENSPFAAVIKEASTRARQVTIHSTSS